MAINHSRLITYPSIEPASSATKILLIDIKDKELDDVVLFLQANHRDFDVYLYRGETGDLEWLNEVHKFMDATLIQDASQVSISRGAERVGPNQKYSQAVDYFTDLS